MKLLFDHTAEIEMLLRSHYDDLQLLLTDEVMGVLTLF